MPSRNRKTLKDLHNNRSIIMDIGSSKIRVGFSNENKPLIETLNIIGTPKYQQIGSNDDEQMYVGKHAFKNIGMLDISYPLTTGNIDDIRKVILHAVNSLPIKGKRYAYYICLPDNLKPSIKDEIKTICFKDLKAMNVQLFNQSYTSWWMNKATSGIMVHCGNSTTNVVCFKNNHAIPYDMKLAKGLDHTRYFSKLTLKNWDIKDINRLSRTLLENFKTLYCEFGQSSNYIQVPLPNQGHVTIKDERNTSCEIFLDPSKGSIDAIGIHKAIFKVIEGNDTPDYLNIFVSGGVCNLKGFCDVLQISINQMTKKHVRIHVGKTPQLDAWRGLAYIVRTAMSKR